MTLRDFMGSKSAVPKYKIGCEYLEAAIQYKIDNPRKSMEAIYIDIAKKYGVTHFAVNASIKRIIKMSFENMDADVKAKVFQDVKVPTNLIYVESVAYALRKGII